MTASITTELELTDAMRSALGDQYEIVRVGFPAKGDLIMNGEGRIHVVTFDYTDAVRVIIRSIWRWPSWLTAPWIAMDKAGIWHLFDDEPVLRNDIWCGTGVALNFNGRFGFTPPPCADWKQSKRQNPERIR